MPDPCPVPGSATLDDVTAALADLRRKAGNPSFSVLARRIRAQRLGRGVPDHEAAVGRVTVYDCFRPGRRRLDADLLAEIVAALDGDDVRRWREAVAHAQPAPAVSRAAALVEVRRGRDVPARTFVGREEERAQVLAGARVVEVTGMPGVGKTAFALAVARELPGARDLLVADLRGFDPVLAPADPGALLAELVRAVGGDVDAGDKRGELGEGLVREGLTLLLDNAADRRQVEPLVPDRGHVVVTSRRVLDIAHAQRVVLEPLPVADAVELLARTCRTAPDEDSALRLVRLCGALPLQLEVVAGTIDQHPDWSLDDVARRLERRGPEGGVHASLHLSVEQLSPAEDRALCLVALHPGGHVPLQDAAALLDLPEEEAGALLDRLQSEHLVVPGSPDGASVLMHDLVREFVLARADATVPWSVQEAARGRLVTHFLSRQHEVEDGAGDVGDLGAQVAAATTFSGTPDVHALALRVGERLRLRGQCDAAIEVLERAVGATDPDVASEARVLLAGAHELSGNFDAAMGWLRGVPGRETAMELNTRGNLALRFGRYDEARTHYTSALERAEADDEPVRVRRALANLGNVNRLLGSTEEATAFFRRAHDASSEAEDDALLALIESNWAMLERTRADLDAAAELMASSISRSRRLGHTGAAAMSLTMMAWVRFDQGELDECERLLDEAEQLAGSVQLFEADVHDCRAKLARARGRLDEAREWHRRALAAGERVASPLHRVNAHNGLGEVELDAGDVAAAAEHFALALELALTGGSPADVRRARAGLETATALPAADGA